MVHTEVGVLFFNKGVICRLLHFAPSDKTELSCRQVHEEKKGTFMGSIFLLYIIIIRSYRKSISLLSGTWNLLFYVNPLIS